MQSEDMSRGVRDLVRGLDRAALATALPVEGAAWPYASLVLAAADHDAAPILLLSDLAQHTLNLKAEPRVSLLFDGTGGLDDPLTGARVTVLGRAERLPRDGVDAARLAARYCARHPSAALYAGFADFHLYRVAVERAHLVAGFGRIDWIAAADLLPPGLAALAASEDEIVRHMNADHNAAVELYARVLLGRDGDGWQLTGIDAEGADLRRGGEIARLDFAAPVGDAQEARAALAALARQARAG